MVKGSDVEKVSISVKGQLGALTKYLKDMEEVSNKLKGVKDYDDKQTRELISKLFKIYRFVGRTEAREKRSEERLDKDLHESLNDLDDKRKKDVENLINKFHAMTNTLVKDLSLFSGSVKDELKGLETEEKFIEHLEKRDWSKVDEEKEKLASKVGDLSDHLAKLEKFCQGAIVTINEIRDKLK